MAVFNGRPRVPARYGSRSSAPPNPTKPPAKPTMNPTNALRTMRLGVSSGRGINRKVTRSVKHPVKSSSVHVQKGCNVLAALSGVDELPGVVDLLRGEFRLASEFHATVFQVV